ncbi:MAG: ABC transporter substrate-binding protein [Clostridiales bacterium]|nr:ABC transporter substrate-binding protein [Clostridiales bacterium]
MKKYIALFAAAVMVITLFSACSAKTADNTSTTAVTQSNGEPVIPNDDTSFKLSYTQSDSLDPFSAVTLNNQILSQLVFEGLFKLDENYKASPNIASAYEYTDGTTLKVSILTGRKFSDGSELTASDVASSFNAAKKSDYWGSALSAVKSCSADTDYDLTFKLNAPNNYAHNLLTFPIKSSGSNSGYPVGSGRYYYADENGATVLKANATDSFNPHITTIHLENIASEDSIDNAVNIGNISFAFRDLSSNTSKKISANKKLVNMNNLVFLGVNNKSGITSNPNIRKAISLAVSRSTLSKSAYGGFAQPATSVFNPQFELSQTELFEKDSDMNAAKQALIQSGASSYSVSLLVNSENSERLTCAKLIKQELEEAGFSVSIVQAASSDEYFKLISEEKFDIYLGEIKLAADMALYNFFEKDASANYGIDTQLSNTAKLYSEYMSGTAELGSFLLAFSDEMPYIPLLYRKGMICFTKTLNGDMQGTYNDCFANIEDWYFVSQ